MKKIFLFLTSFALLLNVACGTRHVTVTYRPVAQFTGFNDMTNNSGGMPAFAGDGKTWVYYRIERIDNSGKGATAPFQLDYSRFYVENADGTTTASLPSAGNLHGMLNQNPFHQKVAPVPPQQVMSFPAGQDPAPRLFVWQQLSTGVDRLRYRTAKGAPLVIVVRDKNAPAMFSPDPAPMTNKIIAANK